MRYYRETTRRKSIVQIKKSTEQLAKKLEKFFDDHKTLIDELEDIISDMTQLSSDVEENIDALNEKDNLNETQELRLGQYEELKGELDNQTPDLEGIKTEIENIVAKFDMLNAIAEQNLY